MISDRAALWLRLAMVRGVGPMLGRKLVHTVGDIESLWRQSEAALQSIDGIGAKLLTALHESQPDSALASLELCQQQQISLLCPDDAAWPEALAVTTSCSINFMRKPLPTDLIAEARVIKLGKVLSVGDVMLFSEGSDKAVAHAHLTYSIPKSR
ncbi:MAG: hypothetical protein JKY87_02970 [Mariprofundus sp.]|nr:hypothetical protein [Mariprofundus sp.]